MNIHYPPTPSSQEEEGHNKKATSSSEEGVGGGVSQHQTMVARARKMRREPTEPERRMWMALRDSRLGGHKFRRQTVIEYRIADFFCPAKGLIVEIDGETHDRERDEIRDRSLESRTGFNTIRFTNHEIMTNLEGVQTALLLALNAQADRWARVGNTTPQPPPLKRSGS